MKKRVTVIIDEDLDKIGQNKQNKFNKNKNQLVIHK